MPSVIKRNIFGWWALNDFMTVWKTDYHIMAYAEVDIIFSLSFPILYKGFTSCLLLWLKSFKISGWAALLPVILCGLLL